MLGRGSRAGRAGRPSAPRPSVAADASQPAKAPSCMEIEVLAVAMGLRFVELDVTHEVRSPAVSLLLVYRHLSSKQLSQ